MARTRRTRTRSYEVHTGTRKGTWIIDVTDKRVLTNTESCEDYVGRPVSDSVLNLSRYDRSQFHGMSGTNVGTGKNKVEYERYPYSYQVGWTTSHMSTGAPSDAGQGAAILARTNPSRPTVVPFTIIQDLYDVPRMLKGVGKLLKTPRRLLSPHEAANQYLGAKFGWIPLIDDANKLIHIQDYIHKRVGELHRLYSAGGLKRRITLGNGTASDSGAIMTLNSDLGVSPLITGKLSRITEEKVWGTVRWRPTGTLPHYNPSDAELISKAKQVVSGFSTEGVIKGAWDLLPWTWMVDWFTNIGDWLSQSSSTIPASPVSCNLMRTRTTTVQHTIVNKPRWAEDNGGSGTYVTKSRTPVSGTLSASLPTLDANRLSILGALFVQRFKR